METSPSFASGPESPAVVVTPPPVASAEASYTTDRLGPAPAPIGEMAGAAPMAATAAEASTERPGRLSRLAANIGRIASNAYSRFNTFVTLAQSSGGSEATPTASATPEAAPAAGAPDTARPSLGERLLGNGDRLAKLAKVGVVAGALVIGALRVRHGIDLGGGGSGGAHQEALHNLSSGGGGSHGAAETLPSSTGPVEANIVDEAKGVGKDLGRIVGHELGWPQLTDDEQLSGAIDLTAGTGAGIIGAMLGWRTANAMKNARWRRREATRETVIRSRSPSGRGRRRKMYITETLDARAAEAERERLRAAAGRRTGVPLKHMEVTDIRGDRRTGTNISQRVPGAIDRGPLAEGYSPATASVKRINRRRPSKSIWPYLLPYPGRNRSVQRYGMPRGWRPWRPRGQ